MRYMGKDAALFVAERIIDYNHEKQQQEYLRQKQYIEHKKHMRHMKKSVWMLTIAVSLLMTLCGTIVTLEMQVQEREERMSALRVELAEIKMENLEAKKRLSQNTDYQWVREQAIKLGMSEVTAERVVYYSVNESDYMEQHSDIPVEENTNSAWRK
ncbi:MAG: hypothetical protein J6A92_06345 [Lachnospiraceae bacterium]|nr:hypothetical protein [Lachnospiraceae bacterium]